MRVNCAAYLLAEAAEDANIPFSACVAFGRVCTLSRTKVMMRIGWR